MKRILWMDGGNRSPTMRAQLNAAELYTEKWLKFCAMDILSQFFKKEQVIKGFLCYMGVKLSSLKLCSKLG